ncbi:putative GATA transcription factor 15-like, partial [Capsicum annuum]
MSLSQITSYFLSTTKNYREVPSACNGIVCIASYRGIIFCNPTLREFWELPPSILPHPAYLSPDKDLHFLMDMTIEIGFDINTNDYKVVRILNPSHEYKFEYIDNHRKYISKVQVYNLSTNCWRKLEGLECIIDSFQYSHVLFNRAYHWGGYLKKGDNCIISFDFRAKSFQQVLYPEGKASEGREGLFVLNKTLALICFTEIYPLDVLVHQSIDIWIMKKYGVRESWVKELTVGPIFIKAPLSV